MKKLLFRILIGLVILVVVAIIVVAMVLDSAIKKGVETAGPQLTQVSVKLDSVHLSLLSGSASIKGLVVGNPEGYKSPHAISFGTASVAVSPRSLLSDKIVVKSVRVEAPDITYELGSGGNNLKKILANVEAATGGGTASGDKSKPGQPRPGKKIQVDDFVLTGAKVRVGATALGGTTAITLPDIHLTNLGKDSDGITPAELTKKVLGAITESVTAAAVGDLGKGAVDAAKGVGKTATESVGKTTKGITDLFKKKK
jgi:uncharacterized protein involved in outer membrane biogenesis